MKIETGQIWERTKSDQFGVVHIGDRFTIKDSEKQGLKYLIDEGGVILGRQTLNCIRKMYKYIEG